MMYKKSFALLPVLAGLLFSIHSFAFQPIQKESLYQVYLDLRNVENDRLPVEIITPIVSEDSVEFHMPRVIPGTYDVHNYGRFVADLKAFGTSGQELPVRKLDKNRWLIGNATALYRISYEVEDTYDYKEE